MATGIFAVIVSVIIMTDDRWLFIFGVVLGQAHAVAMRYGLEMVSREHDDFRG